MSQRAGYLRRYALSMTRKQQACVYETSSSNSFDNPSAAYLCSVRNGTKYCPYIFSEEQRQRVGRIYRQYDKSKNETITSAHPIPASGSPLGGLDINVYYTYPGKTPAVPQSIFIRVIEDKCKGHLNINYLVKDFAPESLDLADLQVGPREFTFSDPSSAGANKLKIAFSGVKSGVELRGTSETKLVGKVNGSGYKLEMLGDWVLRREQ